MCLVSGELKYGVRFALLLILSLMSQTRTSFKASKQGCGLSIYILFLRGLLLWRAKTSPGTAAPSIIYVTTKCSGLLVSALLFSQLLPVSFLFTHSFCFLITLACIWCWLVMASSLPPGTLVVSVPLLTGLALGVFWIKFPWVRIRLASPCFQSHPDHRSLASLWIACPLGQVPTALPSAEWGGGGIQLRLL